MAATTKIVSLEELVRIVEKLRQENKTVVHCHGVFDLLHIGHIRYLQTAKRCGDVLLVTVTPDRFVNKGPHRPIFEDQLRTQALAALDCVDYVAINRWPTAVEALRQLRPNVYVKGAEFRERKTPEILQEEAEAATLDIRVEFIEDNVTSSSTYLINHFLSPFSPEVVEYLDGIRGKWNVPQMIECLQQARNLRIGVIGDAILDEYIFCSTLGQSTKSPNIVGRYQNAERFLGGALSVANHLAGFCREVKLVAAIGDEPVCQTEILRRLRPNVSPSFLIRPTGRTTVKQQFRDSYFSSTLFELDHLDDVQFTAAERGQLSHAIDSVASDCDLVVIADYGHGLLHEDAIKNVAACSRFLAVTAPASAANLGYHTISRYPRCHFFALAEHDLRLDRRDRERDVPSLLAELSHQLHSHKSVITMGSRGCVGYCTSGGCQHAPALAVKVVDRQGAAEAAFAAATLPAVLEMPLDQLAFLSNVAGAHAASALGNSHFLEESSFCRTVESLLK